jgi:hypothetical protein
MSISSPDTVNQEAIPNQSEVAIGERIRTDELSQGHLTFAADSSATDVVATVQILPGSEISVSRASGPRFDVGNANYDIRLDDARGTFYVTVSTQLDREFHVEIESQERRVRIDTGGYYLLAIDDNRFEVTVRDGDALLISPEDETKLVNADQTAEINANGIASATRLANYSLVPNPLFDRASGVSTQADHWGCFRPRNNVDEPPGAFQREFFQDRYAMHIQRTPDEQVGPSRTGCGVFLGDLDVSQYESLRIRATLYPISHSLSGCGADGTECVVMLRMQFRNQIDIDNDSQSEWVLGFYTEFDPNSGAQIRCQSCLQDHIRVNKNAWFTFESDDFVLDLPIDDRDLRPVEIINIEFYSSGHKYDMYVGELSLIGVDFDT